MTDRFSRARSRIETHEAKMRAERELSRKLGRPFPDENVRLPKIGEWDISNVQVGQIQRPTLSYKDLPLMPLPLPDEITSTQSTKDINNLNTAYLTKEQIHQAEISSKKLVKKPNKRTRSALDAPFAVKPPGPVNKPRVPTCAIENHPAGTTTTDLETIIKAKHRAPLKPLPTLKPENESDEPIKTQLPLEIFDDSNYIEYPLEELMKHPTAFSRYYDLDGNITWRKCRAISYDPDTELFTIQWDKSDKRKQVPRFNIRFEIENLDKFEKRVEAARVACQRYEIEFRLEQRIQNMPTETLPTLSPDDVNTIVNLTNIDLSQKDRKRADELTNEVRDGFRYINNKIEYQYEIKHNQLIPNRDDFVEILPKDPPIPYYGLKVDKEETDYTPTKETVLKHHLYSNSHILKGMYNVWGTLINSENRLFLCADFGEVMSLEEYMTKEFNVMDNTTRYFKGTIQTNLSSIIAETLQNENVEQRDSLKDRYRKMTTLSMHMLHTFITDIVYCTIHQFIEFYQSKKLAFNVQLVFENGTSNIDPSPALFKDRLVSLLIQLENAMSSMPAIDDPYIGENGEVSFSDCILASKKAQEDFGAILDEIFAKLNEFLGNFKYLDEILCLNTETYGNEFDPKGDKEINEYRIRIAELRAALKQITITESSFDLQIFKISSEQFKLDAINKIQMLIRSLLMRMKELAVENLGELLSEFGVIKGKIQVIPQTPEELAATRKFLDTVISESSERVNQVKRITARYDFLEENMFDISNEECSNKFKLLQDPHRISTLIDDAERNIQIERVRMIRVLRSNQQDLEKEVFKVSETLNQFVEKYTDIDATLDAAEEVDEIMKQLMELKKLHDTYQAHEKIFSFDAHGNKLLLKIIEELQKLGTMWHLAKDWMQNYQKWMDMPFSQIKAEAINAFIINSTKKITKLRKDMVQQHQLLSNVVNPLEEQINQLKDRMPLVTMLKHPGIKTKHWEQISEIVGFSVNPNTGINFKDFLELHIERWQEPIKAIALQAANEHNIESALDKMDAELQEMKFQTAEFKTTGSHILIEHWIIVNLIEDQIVSTQTLLTSPFIEPCKKRATERLQYLNFGSDVMEQWAACQKGWLYLQPIFSEPSIQAKLYQETRDWLTVDKMWNGVMMLTKNHPYFSSVMHFENILKNFIRANELLESITHGLNRYLEMKRLEFSRFFFLSNDELISILSHTKDLDHVEKLMPKLFEYVQKIPRNGTDIVGMCDGLETVKLRTPVKTDTEIDTWMNAFEAEMQTTLQKAIVECYGSSLKVPREQWITMFPAQVILITNQIHWTQAVTAYLRKGANPTTMLDMLTDMVASADLTPEMQRLVSSLIIAEVHNRDIINSLSKRGGETFAWKKHLRYYLNDSQVVVQSCYNEFNYAYEYTGNSSRLVITPLTDRCYQTLLGAFKLTLGGAPSGPAGTGKTETVRDCAKALGRPCVVYNCSDEVTPEQMSQFFAGLASSGSWSCFDEFNRINIEVLSVIAAQIKTIQYAIQTQQEKFKLDSRQLKLNPNAAVCITMNPGYAGRTELPDNLKTLFRPIAMMVPDFVFICEILLFSGGFKAASSLSIKIVALFDLCKKMLGDERHYDWGLRAMKAILTTAAKVKEEKDEKALLKVIIECTRPKLVSADVPIFDSIIKDIFIGVDLKEVSPEGLPEEINKTFIELKLQPLDSFKAKCIEIFKTLRIRHGIMLLGGAMGGKTTSLNVLQHAMGALGSEVIKECLNPKSITISELYGRFEPMTSGWSDGILSSKIRHLSENHEKESWIVVDGPVDSIWIESMNSLLDDNKVLCLPNNERIALAPNVRMVFEVDDLSQASPATVSRCGMIFFDPGKLSWEALLNTWFGNHEVIDSDLRKYLEELMNAYVPSLIRFVNNDGKPVLAKNHLSIFMNLLKIIECFLDLLRKPIIKKVEDSDETYEVDPLDHDIYRSPLNSNAAEGIQYFEGQELLPVFERVFLFAVVWSYGAALGEESRSFFDKFLKDLCEKKKSKTPFPPRNTVFDYFFDIPHLTWGAWCDNNTAFDFIETNSAASSFFISKLMLTHSNSVLLHGPESSKSTVVGSLLNRIGEKYDGATIPISYCTSSSALLKSIKNRLQKRSGAYGPLLEKKEILFLDNLSIVSKDEFGSQPALELVREIFNYGGWYNTKTVEHEQLIDTSFIAACNSEIPARLLWHFYVCHVPQYGRKDMANILTKTLNKGFVKYDDSVKNMIVSTVHAMLDVYDNCQKQLLPVPSKPHYIFSLRDLMKVCKSMFIGQRSEIANPEKFTKLWTCEMQRVFMDRLNTDTDRTAFKRILKEAFQNRYNMKFEDEAPIFHTYNQEMAYRQSESIESSLNVFRSKIGESEIVLFPDCVQHISAVSRVLAQKQGHAMLVGVKSSGRKSFAKFAIKMASLNVADIQITRTYGFADWREDLKTVMKQVGVRNLETCLLLSDSQMIDKRMFEDISNILTYGFVPDIFDSDEIAGIRSALAKAEMMYDEDPYPVFLQRVKDNLHLVLVFSPYVKFKESIAQYPALRNETVIDWYMPWSNDALKLFAESFFSSIDFIDEAMIPQIVSTIVKIHKSVEVFSARFMQEKKRYTAVTPSRFFELLKEFANMIKNTKAKNESTALEYNSGIEKIKETKIQIEELGAQLDQDMPVLEKKRKEIEEMLKELNVARNEVESVRIEIKKQSDIAEEEAKDAEAKNKIAQDKFAEAEPILIRAHQAVDSIDRDSLVNIKTLKKIHPALRETFEAICIIFGRSPRKNHQTGEEDYWPESLILLNDVQFIKKVRMLEIDKIPKETIKKLKKYVGTSERDRKEKYRQVSLGYKAVGDLYMWICASYDYWHVYQEILPIKLEADDAAAKLAESNKKLEEEKGHLTEVENQLKELEEKTETEKKNEEQMAENIDVMRIKINRANKILSGLTDETKRWGEIATSAVENNNFLVGDSLMIASVLTYIGVFDPTFRDQIKQRWSSFLIEAHLQNSKMFSIQNALGSDDIIRDWIVKGLPNDSHSVENALVIQSTKAFPLLIDPQMNGTKWLRAILGEKLVVLHFDQKDFSSRLRSCIVSGLPVLIENIGTDLDPSIDPVLAREFIDINGIKHIMIGGDPCPYSEHFKLYLSTKHPNPKLSPEVCSMVCLINFTTTEEGLTDLLMNSLIEVEREDLSTKRIQIMEENAANLIKLKEIEKEILVVIGNESVDLLKNDEAANTLMKAQLTSQNIEKQLQSSIKTETLIDQFKDKFMPVAKHAALLYFCAADFNVVDPMYQFSLKWFVSIFQDAVRASEHPNDPKLLIEKINISVAKAFFDNVSISLFSRHRLLFTFLMATRILKASGEITDEELAFLLNPKPKDGSVPIKWLPKETKKLLLGMESLEAFNGITKKLAENEKELTEFYYSKTPETYELPIKMTPFQRLIFLRVFCLHRMREGLAIFVEETLGKEFVAQPLNLTKTILESKPMTPLIFITTPGIDPMNEIMEVAENNDLTKYMRPYSLGRGRGDGAEELILDAAEKGFWVILQNCHLSLSFMPRLERILDNLNEETIHNRFRLSMVTMSTPEFPIGILYMSKKLIYEIPRGIRENVLRSYSHINADEYNESENVLEKQLIFNLSLFHAVILERVQFGSIGFTVPYEFNPSDFDVAMSHLRSIVAINAEDGPSMNALNYIIGELDYGGRITDARDKRLLLTLLERFLDASNGEMTFEEKYGEVIQKIQQWPSITSPSSVGLAANAATILARSEAEAIFSAVIEIQPSLVAPNGGQSEDEFALRNVQEISSLIPHLLSTQIHSKDADEALLTVLRHELAAYNRLIKVMADSLSALSNGLKGVIVIDEDMEELNRSLLSNKVPNLWREHSYTTVLSLRDYLEDLKNRTQFLDSWARSETPKVFRLGVFFHPEEFLTAVLQIHARKHSVAFEELRWSTSVTAFPNARAIPNAAADGVFIEGLSIEGAKWDISSKCLTEAPQMELISPLPVIQLLPESIENPLPENVYECPVYRTRSRMTGALDLPNCILNINLPTRDGIKQWIERAVAVFITV